MIIGNNHIIGAHVNSNLMISCSEKYISEHRGHWQSTDRQDKVSASNFVFKKHNNKSNN